jgi:RNA polymerase sigma-70 factor (ECF subfamily)
VADAFRHELVADPPRVALATAPGNDSCLTVAIPCTRGTTVEQRALVLAARDGDHDAFALLASQALARLDAVARLILRDADLARDAVQEAMVKAWRDLPGLRDPERWDAWIHRITVNSAIEAARRRRRRVVEIELLDHDTRMTPDAQEQVLDRQVLEEALASLEPEQRALVVLRYYLGLSVPEAADTLGIPLGTAKSRLHRSLLQMRSVVVGPDRAMAPGPGGQA